MKTSACFLVFLTPVACISEQVVVEIEEEEIPISRPSDFVREGDRYTGQVTNPTSENELSVVVDIPSGEGPWPLVVLVPGGTLSGSDSLPEVQRGEWMEAGFALATWDPDGRGESAGSENSGGQIHQDGLAAVMDATSILPVIDSNRVGLVSFSYGIVMAAGMLVRHDSPARFLVDWEGPASRWDTMRCAPDITPPPDAHRVELDISCEDESYWVEREAIRAVGMLQIPYHRVQFAQDHKQPDTEHDTQMIQAAIRGGVVEVWHNNQQVQSVDDELLLLSDQTRNQAVIRYAVERMEAVSNVRNTRGSIPAHLEDLDTRAPRTDTMDRPRRRGKRR